MSSLDPQWDPWEQSAPMQSWTEAGRELRVGQRVQLAPSRRADIFDMTLAGMTAVIDAIEQDFDDNVHVAVVLDEDPGRDLGEAHFGLGHRFFFKPAEVVPLDGEPGG